MRYKEKYNWLLLLFVAICCFACTVEREPTDGYTPAGTRSEVPMSVHLGVLGAATDPEQINTAEAAIRRLRLYVFDGNVTRCIIGTTSTLWRITPLRHFW